MKNPKFLVGAILVGACVINVPSVVNGSGNVRTEQRPVEAFTGIEIRNGIKLELTIGSPQKVEVSAQENILAIVSTTVANGRLTIVATQNYNSISGVVARVVTPSLPDLALIAGANAEAAGIAEAAMTLRLESGAVATLSGTVDALTLTASDGALLNLGGLSARTATVTLQNGVTGTMAATESVSGSASNGVLLSITGGGAVNVAASGGAIVTSQ